MKVVEFLQNIAIPLISVSTAVMVGYLNFQVSENELELKQRDQQLQARLAEIDLEMQQNRELREERESNQDFNLKIYDIVTQSLEEQNTQKQEAAKAFVVVMVDEPLRSSLLNVLKQGGSAEVKRNVSRILAAEEKFYTNTAAVPQVRLHAPSTYAWGEWDFDIFWCSSSGQIAQQQAEKIGEQLLAEGAKGRIRIRELPDSINARAGYQISGYAIRHNDSETETAKALKSLAEKRLDGESANAEFILSLSLQPTAWYISAFVCPVN